MANKKKKPVKRAIRVDVDPFEKILMERRDWWRGRYHDLKQTRPMTKQLQRSTLINFARYMEIQEILMLYVESKNETE